MSDAPLTLSETDLAYLASQHVPDGLLAKLLELAETGVGLGVGLLLNGMIVTGRLVGPEAAAGAVDAQLNTLAGPTEESDLTEEERSSFTSLATAAVERTKQQREAFYEELAPYEDPAGIDLDTVPAKLAHQLVQQDARSHLTLEGARLFAPGQAGLTNIATLRVALVQIAAWWVLSTDEQGNARLTFWDTTDPSIQA
jgi:hypothetical protein